MPIFLGKWKSGDEKVTGIRDAIVVATRDVPRLQTAVFVVSFDADESKTWKELHKHTLRPYHDTTSTYNGIPQRQVAAFLHTIRTCHHSWCFFHPG